MKFIVRPQLWLAGCLAGWLPCCMAGWPAGWLDVFPTDVYIYIYIYVYLCAYIRFWYLHIRIHTLLHIYIYMYIYIYVCICLCLSLYIHIYIRWTRTEKHVYTKTTQHTTNTQTKPHKTNDDAHNKNVDARNGVYMYGDIYIYSCIDRSHARTRITNTSWPTATTTATAATHNRASKKNKSVHLKQFKAVCSSAANIEASWTGSRWTISHPSCFYIVAVRNIAQQRNKQNKLCIWCSLVSNVSATNSTWNLRFPGLSCCSIRHITQQHKQKRRQTHKMNITARTKYGCATRYICVCVYIT